MQWQQHDFRRVTFRRWFLRSWPLLLVLAIGGLLWFIGPVGLAVFWPLILVAVFVFCLWLLSLRRLSGPEKERE